MERLIILLWLVIIIVNLLLRNRKKRQADGMTKAPAPRTAMPAGTAPLNAPRKQPAFSKPKQQKDMGMQGSMHMGRPDLEPGYMYLNGVKVLIKEADRLEFLR